MIEAALADYKNAAAAYAMDRGVTDDGRTLLAEVNAGYSVGVRPLLQPLRPFSCNTPGTAQGQR